ncbi:unnamed protein product, partial [Discosporangium mesarthrocarpum]
GTRRTASATAATVASMSSSSSSRSTTSILDPPPALCPVLISENAFHAVDVMAGGGGRNGAGVGGSLAGRAAPLHIRFPSYSQENLPDVLAQAAGSYGIDLSVPILPKAGRGKSKRDGTPGSDNGSGGGGAGTG